MCSSSIVRALERRPGRVGGEEAEQHQQEQHDQDQQILPACSAPRGARGEPAARSDAPGRRWQTTVSMSAASRTQRRPDRRRASPRAASRGRPGTAAPAGSPRGRGTRTTLYSGRARSRRAREDPAQRRRGHRPRRHASGRRPCCQAHHDLHHRHGEAIGQAEDAGPPARSGTAARVPVRSRYPSSLPLYSFDSGLRRLAGSSTFMKSGGSIALRIRSCSPTTWTWSRPWSSQTSRSCFLQLAQGATTISAPVRADLLGLGPAADLGAELPDLVDRDRAAAAAAAVVLLAAGGHLDEVLCRCGAGSRAAGRRSSPSGRCCRDRGR